jgi:uncharacterized protein YcfJ
MNNFGRLGITALLIVSSASALAYRRDRGAPSYPEEVEYAPVTRVEPIYESRQIVRPQEQCWTESVPVRSSSEPHSYTAPILGAIVGGALGNALGHHDSNKKVGTVVGAALGGSIGRDIGNRNGGYQQTAYRDEEMCRTVERSSYRDEVVAYRVNYRYHGRDYTTEMPYDPGARIPVHVDVEPAGW